MNHFTTFYYYMIYDDTILYDYVSYDNLLKITL